MPPIHNAADSEDTEVHSPFGNFRWAKYFKNVDDYIMSRKPTLFFNGKHYFRPIFATTEEELGEYGVGVRLYFGMLKILIVIFFTLTLFALPSIILNTCGSILTNGEMNYRWEKTVISNIGEYPYVPSNSTDIEIKEAIINRNVICAGYKIPLKDLTIVLSALDTVATIFLFCTCIWISYYFIPKVVRVNSHHQRFTKDFSFEIKGLPRRIKDQFVYREELKNHLQNVTGNSIKGVTLVRDYHQKIKDIVDLRNLSQKGRSLFARALLGQGSPIQLSEVQNTYERQKVSVARFEDKEKLDVLRAYVICNSVQSRNAILDKFRFSGNLFSCMENPELKFYGRSLEIKEAPEPNSILWDNLDMPLNEKRKSKIGICFFAIILLVVAACISVGITAWSRSYSRDNTITNTCEAYFTNEDIPLTLAQCWIQESNVQALPCYCKQYSLATLATNQSIQNVCSDYFKQQGISMGLSALSGAIVLILNIAIRWFLEYIVQYERPSSVSEKQKSITSKIFFALFINTAVVTVLTNANFGVKLGILSGEFDDFSKGWYSKVGSWLIFTMLLNVIVSPLMSLLLVLYNRIVRNHYLKKCITQEEVEELLEPLQFQLPNRVAQQLNTIFVALTFSAGIPLLYPIAFLTFIVTYWIDKYIFLRHSAEPPGYDESTAQSLGRHIPWAGVMHVLFAIWMFGQPVIYPSFNVGNYINNYFNDVSDAINNLRRLDNNNDNINIHNNNVQFSTSDNYVHNVMDNSKLKQFESEYDTIFSNVRKLNQDVCDASLYPTEMEKWITLDGFSEIYDRLKYENTELSTTRTAIWDGYGLIHSFKDVLLRISSFAGLLPFLLFALLVALVLLRFVLFLLSPSLVPIFALIQCLGSCVLSIVRFIFCCSNNNKKKKIKKEILYDDFKAKMKEEGKPCNYRLDLHPNYVDAFAHFKNAYNLGYDDEVDNQSMYNHSNHNNSNNNTEKWRKSNKAVLMVLAHQAQSTQNNDENNENNNQGGNPDDDTLFANNSERTSKCNKQPSVIPNNPNTPQNNNSTPQQKKRSTVTYK